MAVSQRDRSFFTRLGAYKEASHQQAAADHLAQPLAERLKRSWALFEQFRSTAALELPSDPGAKGFYERARALGLYRP